MAKGYIKKIRDTMGMDEEDEQEALDKMKKDKESAKKDPVKKDSNSVPPKNKIEAVLPDERRREEVKDTVKN